MKVTDPLLKLIQEIDRLWDPVYPYLQKQIVELYSRSDGDLLEIGPFCGVLFSLMEHGIGDSFTIATFPKGMGEFFLEESRKKGVEKRINILETDSSLKEVGEQKVDLAIFRGAFFFPSLFKVDFRALDRVLKPGGMAFIGGGFGKFTPDELIRRIGERSKRLNIEIGKVEISEDQIYEEIRESDIKVDFKMIKEGGLWVWIRKSTLSLGP